MFREIREIKEVKEPTYLGKPFCTDPKVLAELAIEIFGSKEEALKFFEEHEKTREEVDFYDL